MENFKGKWCINITKENKSYLQEHLKCGAGYYIDQTIFFNEDGIRINAGLKFSWNMDFNNICIGDLYNEISFFEFQNMVNGVQGESVYEIY